MALKTLSNIKSVNGVKIWHNHGGSASGKTLKELGHYISVEHENNTICFKIQKGPIKENGVNGCQVDDIIAIAKTIVEGLNKNFPCSENHSAIMALDNALWQLKDRKRDRIERGVEGTNQE